MVRSEQHDGRSEWKVLDGIDRQSKASYYYQPYEILRDRTMGGTFAPGQALPPEQELVEAYDISRTTVHHALGQLLDEGFVYRQSGRGTFVGHSTVEQGMGRITSFTEDVRQRGSSQEGSC
jgi:GntR family transcriptional regulator